MYCAYSLIVICDYELRNQVHLLLYEKTKQENHAIAMMTTRCAQYMSSL